MIYNGINNKSHVFRFSFIATKVILFCNVAKL